MTTSQDWDFKSADTKYSTHGFHTYPAMMIPQIAGRLIDTFGKGAKSLLDPYCGTGTSLVEAKVRSKSAGETHLKSEDYQSGHRSARAVDPMVRRLSLFRVIF